MDAALSAGNGVWRWVGAVWLEDDQQKETVWLLPGASRFTAELSGSSQSLWLTYFPRGPFIYQEMKLVTGGFGFFFARWQKNLGDEIEFVPAFWSRKDALTPCAWECLHQKKARFLLIFKDFWKLLTRSHPICM